MHVHSIGICETHGPKFVHNPLSCQTPTNQHLMHLSIVNNLCISKQKATLKSVMTQQESEGVRKYPYISLDATPKEGSMHWKALP